MCINGLDYANSAWSISMESLRVEVIQGLKSFYGSVCFMVNKSMPVTGQWL